MKRTLFVSAVFLAAIACQAQHLSQSQGGPSVLNTYFKSINKQVKIQIENSCVAPVISNGCAIVETSCLGDIKSPFTELTFSIKQDADEQHFSSYGVDAVYAQSISNENSVLFYRRIIEDSDVEPVLRPVKAAVVFHDLAAKDKKYVPAPMNKNEPFLVQKINGISMLLGLNSENSERINLIDNKTAAVLKELCPDATFINYLDIKFREENILDIDKTKLKGVEEKIMQTRSDAVDLYTK